MNTSMALINQALFENGLRTGEDIVAYTMRVLSECEAMFGE